MSSKRKAWVILARPGAGRARVLFTATTVRRCERFIARREKRDPSGVHRGDYGIDATPAADAEYQRLRGGIRSTHQ